MGLDGEVWGGGGGGGGCYLCVRRHYAMGLLSSLPQSFQEPS